MIGSIVFLGDVITIEGIKVNEEKIQAINDCSVSKNIHNVRSFHALLLQ